MAKPTKRERKDEAKQARLEAIRRQARRRRMRRIYSATTIVVAVALIVYVVYESGKGDRDSLKKLGTLAAEAGCTPLQKPPAEGNDHVADGAITYKTSPPTSGNHRGVWDSTGVHTTPIVNELQVHNLEHGAVILQYKDTLPAPDIQALQAVARANDKWVISAPKPDMPANVQVAFSAWSRLIACDKPPSDPAKLSDLANAFVKQFRDKSPRESVAGTPIVEGAPPTSPSPPAPGPTATAP